MIEDPIDVLICVIGILLSPPLTLCVILWKLGHPILGIFALLWASSNEGEKKK